MRTKTIDLTLFTLALAILVWMSTRRALCSEETGKLRIHVQPKQAYVFVDGKAIREGSQTSLRNLEKPGTKTAGTEQASLSTHSN